MKYYKKTRFRPKRPVRSFRDLIVYQKALEGTVVVAKRIMPVIGIKRDKRKTEDNVGIEYPKADEMITCSLEIPRQIAEAHSIRFNNPKIAIDTLEQAMAGCNKMVVYCEQIRDIYGSEVDRAVCEDLIKKYIYLRRKIFNLEKAWKKFMEKDNA